MSTSESGRNQLLVLLRVNGRCHALPAKSVVEVLAWVPAHPLPLAPAPIKGMFNYRGQWIPVVDLHWLLDGADCPRWMASRTVIVPVGRATQRLVGLRVEACELLTTSEWARQPGLQLPDAPFLGEVLAGGDQLIQLLKPEDLLDSTTLEAIAGLIPEAVVAGAVERHVERLTE